MMPCGAAAQRPGEWVSRTRTAMVSRPAVTPDTTASGRTGTTRERPGPAGRGQPLAIPIQIAASARAAATSAAINGKASPAERPLAAKIAAIASSRPGSAPRP